MRTVVSTSLLLLASLGVEAGYLLAHPPDWAAHDLAPTQAERLLALVPDPEARGRLRARSLAAAEAVSGGGRTGGTGLGAVLRLAATRTTLAWAALPVAAGIVTLGVLAGLLLRRLRIEEVGFHSLTFSYVGKALASFAVAAYAFTALAPVGPPLWTLYAFAVAGAAGAALYFGNLPPRL